MIKRQRILNINRYRGTAQIVFERWIDSISYEQEALQKNVAEALLAVRSNDLQKAEAHLVQAKHALGKHTKPIHKKYPHDTTNSHSQSLDNQMIAHVFDNGYHYRLSIATRDLEHLVYRCGWHILNTLPNDAGYIEHVSHDAREEIDRLRNLIFIDATVPNPESWWNQRLISATPKLTPDQ